MSKSDETDGVGYVICGYLDAEGPESTTIEGDFLRGGQAYSTIEEAVAEIHANGGPRADANIFIGAVVPVALIVQPDATYDDTERRAFEVADAFGSFYSVNGGEMLFTAGNGRDGDGAQTASVLSDADFD